MTKRIFYVCITLVLCYLLEFLKMFLNTILFVALPSFLDDANNATHRYSKGTRFLDKSLYSQSAFILSSKQFFRFFLLIGSFFVVNRVRRHFLIFFSLIGATSSQVGLLLSHNFNTYLISVSSEAFYKLFSHSVVNLVLSQLFRQGSKWNVTVVSVNFIINVIGEIAGPVFGGSIYK